MTDDMPLQVASLASLSPVQSPEDPTLHETTASQAVVDLGEISVNMTDSFARFSEGVNSWCFLTRLKE